MSQPSGFWMKRSKAPSVEVILQEPFPWVILCFLGMTVERSPFQVPQRGFLEVTETLGASAAGCSGHQLLQCSQ